MTIKKSKKWHIYALAAAIGAGGIAIDTFVSFNSESNTINSEKDVHSVFYFDFT